MFELVTVIMIAVYIVYSNIRTNRCGSGSRTEIDFHDVQNACF